MSIIAMLSSALAGTGAAGAGAASTAATAAAPSFVDSMMSKAGSALDTIGEYAGKATDAVGLTDNAGEQELAALQREYQRLQEEAEFIKAGDQYASEADRDTDLAENATRSQEVRSKIDALEKKSAERSQQLSGTLDAKADIGSAPAAPIVSSGSVSVGSFDPNALMGASMAGLTGTLGGAPQTTQQQLIMAQNKSLGGFRL